MTTLLACGVAPAWAMEPAQPSAAELTQALKRFLDQRGDICLGKYDWPIDVSDRDVAAGTRDAVQLPVMERVGLVTSDMGYVVYKDGDTEEKVPTRRYRLTDLGQRSYRARETTSRVHGGPLVSHHGDLCAGHVDLVDLARIQVPAVPGAGQDAASASYHYRFTPQPWADGEAIRRVFPLLDQLIKGQGRTEMTQAFHFQDGAWVADTAID